MADNDLPLGKMMPEDTAMELKCVVSTPVLMFLDNKFGKERAKEIVAETGLNASYLSNVNNWISLNYFCRLLDKVIEVTGDPRVPFEMTQLNSNPATFRAVSFILKHLGTPRDVYRLIVQFHHLWDRISEYRLLTLKSEFCVIEIKLLGFRQQKCNCLAIQGCLSAVPAVFGLPYAQVEEKQCSCDGAGSCVYAIRWVNKPGKLWACAGGLAGAAAGMTAAWCLQDRTAVAVLLGLVSCLAGYWAGRAADHCTELRQAREHNEGQAAAILESLRDIEKLNHELKRSEARLRAFAARLESVREEERTTISRTIHDDLGHMLTEIRMDIAQVEKQVSRAAPDGRPDGLHATMVSVIKTTDNLIERVREIATELRPSILDNLGAGAAIEWEAHRFAERTGMSCDLEGVDQDVRLSEEQASAVFRVFQEMLANIARHSGATNIAIGLEETGAEIVLKVRDNGRGMDVGRTSDIMSLGILGMQERARSLSGSLLIEGSPGNGTTVTMRIPRAAGGRVVERGEGKPA